MSAEVSLDELFNDDYGTAADELDGPGEQSVDLEEAVSGRAAGREMPVPQVMPSEVESPSDDNLGPTPEKQPELEELKFLDSPSFDEIFEKMSPIVLEKLDIAQIAAEFAAHPSVSEGLPIEQATFSDETSTFNPSDVPADVRELSTQDPNFSDERADLPGAVNSIVIKQGSSSLARENHTVFSPTANGGQALPKQQQQDALSESPRKKRKTQLVARNIKEENQDDCIVPDDRVILPCAPAVTNPTGHDTITAVADPRDEKERRKRLSNQLSSRRRRERENAEVNKMKADCEKLEAERHQVCQDVRSLQSECEQQQQQLNHISLHRTASCGEMMEDKIREACPNITFVQLKNEESVLFNEFVDNITAEEDDGSADLISSAAANCLKASENTGKTPAAVHSKKWREKWNAQKEIYRNRTKILPSLIERLKAKKKEFQSLRRRLRTADALRRFILSGEYIPACQVVALYTKECLVNKCSIAKWMYNIFVSAQEALSMPQVSGSFVHRFIQDKDEKTLRIDFTAETAETFLYSDLP